MPNDTPAEFDEDAAHPIRDFSYLPNHSQMDSLFTYCDADIDTISDQLGIPWEPSKTIPFSMLVPYLGFEWNLSDQTVAITEKKKNKYKTAIGDWLSRLTHTLEEAQKLYSKLLHASLIIQSGHAYLTSLEALMGSFNSNPFIPHHAPRHTKSDLEWWINVLNKRVCCDPSQVYFTLPLVVRSDSGRTPPVRWTSTGLWSFVLDSAGCPVIVR